MLDPEVEDVNGSTRKAHPLQLFNRCKKYFKQLGDKGKDVSCNCGGGGAYCYDN